MNKAEMLEAVKRDPNNAERYIDLYLEAYTKATVNGAINAILVEFDMMS